MLTKLLGWVFIFLGVGTIVFMPYTKVHQHPKMVTTIIVIGIILLGFGLFLLKL